MSKEFVPGLRANIGQFALLVAINAFVGGMVGLERTILPEIAGKDFHMAAGTALFSFIVVFGLVKAATNYFMGSLANRFGRKKLLIAGWLFAVPVPIILMYADHWNWIVFANVLLGINQGLAWSATVIMKIDLVGEKDRGFAMGLNEFSGYIAVALMAFLSGWIASEHGLRPYPFILGLGLVALGLTFSMALVRDTTGFMQSEASLSTIPRLSRIFSETTWRHKNLGSVTQAGLINNLNDGMMWGLFPVLLSGLHFELEEIAMITSVYPAVWGIGQLFTGKMSDRLSKKSILFCGMTLQGIAILALLYTTSTEGFLVISIVLGCGTAMVYPTFLAVVAENTHPVDRPKSLGVFRMWRDSGYAIGAVITGVLAEAFDLMTPVAVIGILTLLSAIVIQIRMTDVIKHIHFATNRNKSE